MRLLRAWAEGQDGMGLVEPMTRLLAEAPFGRTSCSAKGMVMVPVPQASSRRDRVSFVIRLR